MWTCKTTTWKKNPKKKKNISHQKEGKKHTMLRVALGPTRISMTSTPNAELNFLFDYFQSQCLLLKWCVIWYYLHPSSLKGRKVICGIKTKTCLFISKNQMYRDLNISWPFKTWILAKQHKHWKWGENKGLHHTTIIVILSVPVRRWCWRRPTLHLLTRPPLCRRFTRMAALLLPTWGAL